MYLECFFLMLSAEKLKTQKLRLDFFLKLENFVRYGQIATIDTLTTYFSIILIGIPQIMVIVR